MRYERQEHLGGKHRPVDLFSATAVLIYTTGVRQGWGLVIRSRLWNRGRAGGSRQLQL